MRQNCMLIVKLLRKKKYIYIYKTLYENQDKISMKNINGILNYFGLIMNRIFLRISYISLVIILCLLYHTWFRLYLPLVKTENMLSFISNKNKHEKKLENTSKDALANEPDRYLIDTIGCKILAIDIPETNFNINRSSVVCPGPPRLTKVVGTILYVDQSIKAAYYSNKIKRCQKWSIKRGNSDNDIVFGKPTTFHNQTKIDAEFSVIKCVGFNNSVLYTDFHSRIIDKEHVRKKLKSQSGKRAEDIPLSVLLIGIDSTSRNSFSRQMPRLKKYLLETLKAYSFPGLTRVGVNTLPNIIPLLTGKLLNESKYRQGMPFDSVDFIWKNYSSKNAITLLVEDRPRTGAFNFYRRKQTRMMMSNRSISLMSPIPSNRTCKEAEIPAQFCECFSARKQVSVENVNVTQAANAVVKSLNKRLEKGKAKKCAKLKLKKIIRAFKYRSTYSVTLKVSPSEGIFQSLGEYRGKIFRPFGEILRINIYGNQSHCVNTPNLKPFCFCV
uniref:Uncharacterized protein n=1 Tax=Octopus bimaculoides TaxID=37653 RepID=A0A0L8GXE7_OCTBM